MRGLPFHSHQGIEGLQGKPGEPGPKGDPGERVRLLFKIVLLIGLSGRLNILESDELSKCFLFSGL